MEKMVFRMKGMDCGEEVAILRRELGPLVNGEQNLAFDLVNRRLIILKPNDDLSIKTIREIVAKAGMEAVPWPGECSIAACPTDESVWLRKGRLIMCGASGLMMLAGISLQAYHGGGPVQGLAGGGPNHAPFPMDALLFYVGAIVSGGWLVLPKALHALRKLRPDMNLLMTVAVIGAMGIGQWLEAASVTFLFSLALLLESWSVDRARQAITSLVDVAPARARFISPDGGRIEERAVAEIPVGVIVLVRPGEKIPLDGVVTKGVTSVNQAPISGESKPVHKGVGDKVFAGTINGEGSIELRTTRPAGDTTLARILHMVEDARSRRAPAEQWVDRLARVYTPAMMVLAILVAPPPPLLFGEGWSQWLYRALVLLVIALMSHDLSKLPWLIRHSRRTLGIIKANIVFSLAVKIAFVVLSLGGLSTLWRAIAADMGASLLVISKRPAVAQKQA